MAASSYYKKIKSYKIVGDVVSNLDDLWIPYENARTISSCPFIKPVEIKRIAYYKFYNDQNQLIFITDEDGFSAINNPA